MLGQRGDGGCDRLGTAVGEGASRGGETGVESGREQRAGSGGGLRPELGDELCGPAQDRVGEPMLAPVDEAANVRLAVAPEGSQESVEFVALGGRLVAEPPFGAPARPVQVVVGLRVPPQGRADDRVCGRVRPVLGVHQGGDDPAGGASLLGFGEEAGQAGPFRSAQVTQEVGAAGGEGPPEQCDGVDAVSVVVCGRPAQRVHVVAVQPEPSPGQPGEGLVTGE